jgi:hypothetical protein
MIGENGTRVSVVQVAAMHNGRFQACVSACGKGPSVMVAARDARRRLDLWNVDRVRSSVRSLTAAFQNPLLVVREMMVHLGIERAFCQCLLQRIQQATLLRRRSGIAAGQ